jgi:type I restriction enzyme R subunit
MSATDISEKGLETLIMRHITGADGLAFEIDGVVAEMPLPTGNGWLVGNPKDFDRRHAVDARHHGKAPTSDSKSED